MLIAIAVAVLLPKCQTNSCENASLRRKIICTSDLFSLSIFIPALSPIDCSLCFLQCIVQLLSLGFMVMNTNFKKEPIKDIKMVTSPLALSLNKKYCFLKFIIFLCNTKKNTKCNMLAGFKRFLLVFHCLL